MISFIVPVFNTAKYLRKCIDSIIKQNLISYEILIVDDGSTDNSLSICKEYESKYSNIFVLSQENSGPSAARNKGLLHAKGDYIFFIDSDDYYIEGTLKKFEDIIEKKPTADLIFGKIMTFYDNSDKKNSKINYYNTSEINSMTGEEALNYLIKTSQVMISNYSALIKRDLLVKNNINFNEKLNFAEDVDFMIRVYCSSRNTQFIDNYFLMYRKNREGQLTQKVNFKKLNMAVNLYNELISEIEEWNIDNISKKLIKQYISNLYFSSIGSLKKKDPEYKKKLGLLMKYKYLIKYTGGKRFIFYKYVYFIFGFKATSKIMNFTKSMYRKFKANL